MFNNVGRWGNSGEIPTHLGQPVSVLCLVWYLDTQVMYEGFERLLKPISGRSEDFTTEAYNTQSKIQIHWICPGKPALRVKDTQETLEGWSVGHVVFV